MPREATDSFYLSDISPRDERWNTRKALSDTVKKLYQGTVYDKYAARMSECSGYLQFTVFASDTGEVSLKLEAAKFCRVRHCPVCQWRRSLMWRAKVIKTLPKLIENFPRARFIFLTMTVRNCPLPELRSQLEQMNKAWNRLTQRKQWPAQGWLRAVEITRGSDDTAHPHFHCLLMVKPGYFSGQGYLSQQSWTELWQSCLGVDYKPIVDVRAIRPRKSSLKGSQPTSTSFQVNEQNQPDSSGLVEAVMYTLKYSVKPGEFVYAHSNAHNLEHVVISADDNAHIEEMYEILSDKAWLLELTKQLHKTHAVATGGVMREYLKALEEEPDDLIHAEDLINAHSDANDEQMGFGWRESVSQYAHTE